MRRNRTLAPTCHECGAEKWEWDRAEWVCPDCTKIVPTAEDEFDPDAPIALWPADPEAMKRAAA